jgi:hypothetical protein
MAENENTDQPDDALTEEMLVTIKLANMGDFTVLPQLRKLFDERPDLWRQFGDLAFRAEQSLIGLVSGHSELAKEAIRRKLAELKAGLMTASVSPLEKLLIERVSICWLQVHMADLDAAGIQTKDQKANRDDTQATRRLDRAQQRYLASIKVLATVQKLLRPVPSPLDLAARTVSETSGMGLGRRVQSNPHRSGVTVAN